MSVLATTSKTILDLTDGEGLSVYLASNLPRTQMYNTNTSAYSPDWTSTSLVLTPTVYLNQTEIARTDSKLSFQWKRREGSGSEASLTTGETAGTGSNKGKLTVSQNKLGSVTSGILTYILTVTYTNSTTGVTLTSKIESTFTLMSSGSNAKLVSITGDQVFKYTSGGNVSPASITLTANTQNVSVSKWQYKNSSNNWVDYPTGTITGTTLTVAPTHNIWVNNVASIRVTTNDNDIYDTTSIYKVSDGSSITVSSIKYQEGTSATSAPTGTWSDNPVSVAEGNYLWTKTTYSDNSVSYSVARQGEDGSSGSSVTVSSIKYQQGSSATTAPTGTWSENPVSVSAGEYLWTKTTYSDNTVAYTVARQGSNGQNGSDGLNVATVYLYQRASSTPSGPSSSLTYTFATGALSGTLGDWSQSVPSGTDPCYIILATASATTATDTIASSEWSSPVLFVQNGANGTNGTNGTNGADGYNTATIYLYKRATSTPSKPSSSVTYTFSTGALSETPTGWSTTIPDVNGNACYVIVASARSQSATATIASTAWSDPVRLAEDAITVFLTNENILFSADSNGQIPAQTVYCNVAAFQGASKKTVQVGTITGAPTGMVVTNQGVTSQETVISIAINEGATLGSNGPVNGTLTIPVTSPVQTTLYLSWSKVCRGASGDDAYSLIVYAPNGNVFTNGSSNGSTTLPLSVQFFKGSTNLTSSTSAYYTWEKLVSGSWTTVQAEAAGDNGNTLSVSASDVTTSATFRCKARSSSTSTTYFYNTATIIDKTDNYQSNISSTAGDVFQNGVGNSVLACRVWQNGIEVDPLKSTTYSTTNPSSPSTGDFYYKITTNTPVTKLMRYSGSAWVDVTSNATYKHTLTYTWYRLDMDGEPMDSGNAFATGKVIYVDSDDVDGKTTFICEVSKGGTVVSTTQFSIRDDTDIIVSTTAPSNPVTNQLWLDSNESPNVLKRYNGSEWDIVNDTGAIYTEINTNVSELNKTISDTAKQLSDEIERKVSEMAMTDSEFQVMFGRTVQSGINEQISGVQGDLNGYKTEVSNFMRYDNTGTLTLGKADNAFTAELDNQKMAFKENGTEVAYISNKSMYITTARVTDTLSLGTNNGYGYFDWVVTQTGLGLKWRS